MDEIIPKITGTKKGKFIWLLNFLKSRLII